MGSERVEGYQLERFNIGGRQIHPGRTASGLSFCPSHGAEAPGVTRLKSGELKLRTRRYQVITAAERVLQKLVSDHSTYSMSASVVGVGVAAAIAKVSGHRLGATGLEFITKNI